MSYVKFKVIGIASYDDDAIAHMLKQITGHPVYTFNEAFSEELSDYPVAPMILTNVNEHKEASYIRDLGGVMINAPCDGKKSLKPEAGDIIFEVSRGFNDSKLYKSLAEIFEEYLVEHE